MICIRYQKGHTQIQKEGFFVKKFKKAMALSLALAMGLSLVACGDKKEEKETTTAAETTEATTEAESTEEATGDASETEAVETEV